MKCSHMRYTLTKHTAVTDYYTWTLSTQRNENVFLWFSSRADDLFWPSRAPGSVVQTKHPHTKEKELKSLINTSK